MKHHDPDAAKHSQRRPANAIAVAVPQAVSAAPRPPAIAAVHDQVRPTGKTKTAGSGAARMLIAVVASLPLAVAAQDYGAMLQHSLNQSAQMTQAMNQTTNNMVQQRMQDPRVRAGYEQYLAQQRSRGQPAMDYASYTYRYIDTRGFTPDGIAYSRSVDAGIQANERAAVQGLRDAQAARGAAQQAQRDGYARNQQEAGLGLMGQSRYMAPNGAALQLPHTWQKNSTQPYQGQTYRVDHAGQYHVLGANGWWYPLTPR